MTEPSRSPFDEPDDSCPEPPAEASSASKRPPRKWSLAILAVALFVLVWVREFTLMPPPVTFTLAGTVFLGWLVMHFTYFVEPLDPSVRLPLMAARSGREPLQGPPDAIRPYRSGRRWRIGLAGALVGIWIPYLVPVSRFGLTLLCLALGFLMYWLEMAAAMALARAAKENPPASDE